MEFHQASTSLEVAVEREAQRSRTWLVQKKPSLAPGLVQHRPKWREHRFKNAKSSGDATALDFQPPAHVTEKTLRYGHLVSEIGERVEEPVVRQSSRALLSCISPRSPNASKQQVLDLSLSGKASEKWRAKQDTTLQLLTPEVVLGNSGASNLATKRKIQAMINSYDLSVIVLNERLRNLSKDMKIHKRQARSNQFSGTMASLTRDTHKLYSVQLALLTLLDPDLNDSSAKGSLNQFEKFDYEEIAQEPDTLIALATIQRWFAPGGKIFKAFKEIHSHFSSIRKEGLAFESLDISETALDKLDEAQTRCLERIDAASEVLKRLDIRTAATAIKAAVRFAKLSPKSRAAGIFSVKKVE